MRILYGINGTGNGHRSRALELVPALRSMATVDVLLSGAAYSLPMPFDVLHRLEGLSFSYRHGGVDLPRTIARARVGRLMADIRALDLDAYDLVVSDFEPISAWAARRAALPCIGVSHQSSFEYERVPRPRRHEPISEAFLRWFSPSSRPIGLHYRSYQVGILPPIIRSNVRGLTATSGNQIVVYLPAVPLDGLVDVLSKVPAPFQVFSAEVDTPTEVGLNVRLEPASDLGFTRALAGSGGVICHAGFELPSEAMFLRKPMLAVPIARQYEQQCNAAALQLLGVDVVWTWDGSAAERIAEWLRIRRIVGLPALTEPRELASRILMEPLSSVRAA